MKSRFSLSNRLLTILVLGSSPLIAQGSQTANITGTVVDGQGAPLAGVTVRMTAKELQGVRVSTTDKDGHFFVRLLPPGFYNLTITKEGLETRKISEKLGIDQTFSPRIVMTTVSQAMVEVVAMTAALDMHEVKSAANYSADSIDQLPTGRSLDAIALLTPGVTTGVNGRTQIRGAQTTTNLYLLDGQNITDNFYQSVGVAIIDDSVNEVQVVTGAMSAEYGNVEGGVMNAITRSGSNAFAGSLRWDLANPAWSAMKPLQDRAGVKNILGQTKTISLSGPVIKDKLWFSGSFFTTDSDLSQSIGYDLGSVPYASYYGAGNGPGGLNSSITTGTKDIRRQLKLTWAITQDQNLVASYMRNARDTVDGASTVGNLDALYSQTVTSNFINVALRSIWSSNFTSELRFGKKQYVNATTGSTTRDPIWDYSAGAYYNATPWVGSLDGGDHRDNQSGNLKGTLFLSLAGEHTLDFGVDYLEGIRSSRNQQGRNNIIFSDGYTNLTTIPATSSTPAYPGPSGIPYAMYVYQSGSGEAKSLSHGLYVNDKWTVNRHLSLQMGLRWDTYSAKNDTGATSASASNWSPRLGLTYDVKGDGAWIAGLSAARYNGKVQEGLTNMVTSQGNPTVTTYYATSYEYAGYSINPHNRVPFSAITNPANYDTSWVAGYSNPTVNVRLDPKIKPPSVDELQASLSHPFDIGAYGNGYLKLTAVSKKWKNLIDVSVGNNGQVTLPDYWQTKVDVKYWSNNPDATREYKDLELEAQYHVQDWTVQGNITWSSLKGNYEGEQALTPVSGQSIHYYDVYKGTTMYDWRATNGYGPLTGDVPIRMRFTASREYNNVYGRTNVGLVYRFDSGSHYSNYRTIYPAQLNPGLPSAFQYTSQYKDEARGQGVYNGSAFLDLAITHTLPVYQLGDKKLEAFLKMGISNVFNHQQVIYFRTGYNGVPQTAAGSLASPWVPISNFGQPTASSDYGDARIISLSAGLKF